mmetsp:Transcript_59965/g.140065  ORF Transcript_59965/g.140065 Transcript_59965/m.140065 type:complete len:247 (-) Transcript_59965:946-1686(-)
MGFSGWDGCDAGGTPWIVFFGLSSNTSTRSNSSSSRTSCSCGDGSRTFGFKGSRNSSMLVNRTSVAGSMLQPPAGEASSPDSSQRASASRIQGDICPPFTGLATPLLATEASAEAPLLAPGNPGVSTPKPGVPMLCAMAASPPRARTSFVLAPCWAIEFRCSSRNSAKPRPRSPSLPSRASRLSRLWTVVPMPNSPPALHAAAPVRGRETGDSEGDEPGDSRDSRGVGCGDKGSRGGAGARGNRLC